MRVLLEKKTSGWNRFVVETGGSREPRYQLAEEVRQKKKETSCQRADWEQFLSLTAVAEREGL